MDKKVYYESRIQYLVFAGLLTTFLAVMYLVNIKLRVLLIYWLPTSLIAFLAMLFYPVSSIEINNDGIVYKHGLKKMNAKFTEIKGIHFEYAPSIYAGIFWKFQHTYFYLETEKWTSKPIDTANIKLLGHYSLTSRGDELVQEIEQRASIRRDVGQYSVTQQYSWRGWVAIIILILLITVSFYYAVGAGYR
ncbi:MAG: hypothetical protein Q7K26_04570 [bacterium]|nr:hypothetical protein [bacterium]